MTPFIRFMMVSVIVATTLLACQSSSSTKNDAENPQSSDPTLAVSTQDLIGNPIKGSTATVYRLMEDGSIRHISDWATYLALGFEPGDLITISDDELATYPLEAPLTRWVIGETDQSLYLLQNGQRYHIPDAETLNLTGASWQDVTVISDDLLTSFPLADDFPPAFQSANQRPIVTTALENNESIWWATNDGQIHTILENGEQITSINLPDNSVVTAMLDDDDDGGLLVGTYQGDLWKITSDSEPELIFEGENASIATLESDGAGGLWIAERGYYDIDRSTYFEGRGILHLDLTSHEITQLSLDPALQHVTAIAFDQSTDVLWVGTRFHGLYRYDIAADSWENLITFNSLVPDNYIHDLELDADGSLWFTTRTTLSRLRDDQIDVFPSYEPFSTNDSVLRLSISEDKIWVGSEYFVGSWTEVDGWQLISAFDHPYLLDDFHGVLTRDGKPVFIGSDFLVSYNGEIWSAHNIRTDDIAPFVPGELSEATIANVHEFPSPTQDYVGWLQTWPRPEQDNGRCMHYLQAPSGSQLEIRQQIARLEALNVRWVLINYLGPSQLLQMAPLFAEADMMVIWRPFVRAYESYHHWADDVRFLRSIGLPPYIQVYNEPSHEQEWGDQEISQEIYLDHLVSAVQAVYEAGGYIGLQHIQPEWTRATLLRLKSEGMQDVFSRLFFVPHPYGANHPPDYDEDIISVLGFRHYATIFEDEIGFVPMMIAGEGGWRLGQQDDTRYPPVSEALHRDYHVAVFEWFETGQLSNGEPLTDYLFAFCPWLLSDPYDPAAWFDSASGNRTLTIEAVEGMVDFERSFSWDRED